MVKISKKYIPKESEKYMCEKHKLYFKNKLTEWKKDLVRTNNEALYNSSLDDNSTSADIVDQASSYTEKNVEMRAINRQIKLISKIESALTRIKDGTYGFCEETAEPIGLKRLSISKFLAGESYTIADIATWPWIARHEWHDIGLKNFKNLTKWYLEIAKRDAVIKGYDLMNSGSVIPKP